jgi:hypothetical protein
MIENDQIDFVDEFQEVFDFLQEVCSRYYLSKKDGQFDEPSFSDWVVKNAGLLYIKYVLQPGSTHC